MFIHIQLTKGNGSKLTSLQKGFKLNLQSYIVRSCANAIVFNIFQGQYTFFQLSALCLSSVKFGYKHPTVLLSLSALNLFNVSQLELFQLEILQFKMCSPRFCNCCSYMIIVICTGLQHRVQIGVMVRWTFTSSNFSQVMAIRTYLQLMGKASSPFCIEVRAFLMMRNILIFHHTFTTCFLDGLCVQKDIGRQGQLALCHVSPRV